MQLFFFYEAYPLEFDAASICWDIRPESSMQHRYVSPRESENRRLRYRYCFQGNMPGVLIAYVKSP